MTAPARFPRIDQGRADLEAWRRDQRRNFYDDDANFQRLLRQHLGEDRASALEPAFRRFGAVCATVLDEAATTNNLNENLPRLARYDGLGVRIESVEHHPSYRECGKAIYGTGLMTLLENPGHFLHSLALFYLSSQVGEAGHNCPVACTAGVIRVLTRVERGPLRDRYLPRLLDPDFDTNYTGAQFLTEVQGGSDVGANQCLAREGERPGLSRVWGEKWFCSNAGADLILMTARVEEAAEGTRGLGLFLVPRTLEDGSPNHYAIRRLKDKLGTRSMASGEIDFHGALAHAVGPLDQGFKTVMENVIHLSRLYNTVAVAGGSRRAYRVALGYARHRRAFGQPLADFPLVLETLADLRMESAAMLSGGLQACARQDRLDTGAESGEEARRLQTLLANLNKHRSASGNTESALRAIEVLGGNGAIESFSILPRLLRDAVVCENWEGTHNTLRMQTLRDLHKYGVDGPFFRWVDARLSPLREVPDPVIRAREEVEARVRRLKAMDPVGAAWFIRDVVDGMADLHYAALLTAEAEEERRGGGSGDKADLLEYFARKRLGGGFRREASQLDLVRRVALQG